MDFRTLRTLEYEKILARLAAHCDFPASAELARALGPTPSLRKARARLAETSEARRLLASHPMTIGGARDIRPHVDLAARGGVLEPETLLEIKDTLAACRDLKKAILRMEDEYPLLSRLAARLPDTYGIVTAISHAISERGDVLDAASPDLASIRAELRTAHERLISRLQKIITNPKIVPMLQEAIITQRDGRYVIPLRAEFKGQIKAIVHDQSASGATLFIEPLTVVELNNRYRELGLAERDEVRRVLADLSSHVAAHAEALIAGIQALAELDLAFAKARYAEELDAVEPVLLESAKTARLPTLKLLSARHPLLDPETVVPIDVVLEGGVRALVITGPNTGGKTVTLKTVGLLALMAQAGLHIPAQSGSELPCFRAVYADIGDEQSIEQSLSTFSAHIKNIIRILKKADAQSLVLLDELGAGTDPQEGSALARAILSYLLERRALTLVATHYPELKLFAHATPGVVNASVEFDLHTLRPTYHLTIGLPGRSNALAIAKRLGLPEAVLAAARREIHPDDLRADDLLDEIQRQKRLAHRERRKAEKARREAHRLRRELAERLEKIEDERLAILEAAREEAEAQVRALQAEVRELKRMLRKARQPLEAAKEVEAQVEALEARVPKRPPRRRESELDRRPLAVGERVHVRSLNVEGVVTALDGEEAEVQVGALRVRARLDDLRRSRLPEPEAPRAAPMPVVRDVSSPLPSVDLDLRGQRVDEALDALERHLEQACLAGLPFVRVIHGKGTGALRQAVRQALRGHPFVASFEEGKEGEGGAGVTVVRLNEG